MHFSSLDRKFVLHGASGRAPRPFEEKGLALRLAPFVLLILVTLAMVLFAYDGLTPEVVASFEVLALIVGAATGKLHHSVE